VGHTKEQLALISRFQEALADGLLLSLAFFSCFFEGYPALHTCTDLSEHCQVVRGLRCSRGGIECNRVASPVQGRKSVGRTGVAGAL
jgi:hypothetical protein